MNPSSSFVPDCRCFNHGDINSASWRTETKKLPVASLVMDVEEKSILEIVRSNALESIGVELGASWMSLRKAEEIEKVPCVLSSAKAKGGDCLVLKFRFNAGLDAVSGCACTEYVRSQLSRSLPEAKWKIVSIASVSDSTLVSTVVHIAREGAVTQPEAALKRLANLSHPTYGDVEMVRSVSDSAQLAAPAASRIYISYGFKSRSAAVRLYAKLRPSSVFSIAHNNRRTLVRVIKVFMHHMSTAASTAADACSSGSVAAAERLCYPHAALAVER
eukprot:CAMPEP_0170199982 /NCGR_PEP_ID=MMETSP0040_2-20121228/69633_1 /TAXON_ID=641309 /ORGANISM="Lotharella oceanica, Strain CCMP622" /LENGTH=273 /DNA_ID=CAMNT_0010450147 /DNA_START=422 /DNA_END=1244 /DNA_ORIENTATION=-